jgi:peptidyl-prolyl cis-trans isomerase C
VSIIRLIAVLWPAVVLAAAGLSSLPVAAQEKPVATVNGKTITEADLKYADEEIGSDLGSLPPQVRRRALIEYLIEHQLLAEAATLEKLDSGAEIDRRMLYMKRKALRDAYFETSVKGSVKEADAKKLYDSQVANMGGGGEEVKARHILVESEALAKELAAKIAHGDDKTFIELAKQHSKDPGTKAEGGDLGYFGRGQMVPQFEEAAFKLKKGDVSQPVQSQFGWHLIRVDDRREKKPPEFQVVKDRILGSMIHQKAQGIVADLRGRAKIDYLDAEVKKQIDDERAAGGKPKPQ